MKRHLKAVAMFPVRLIAYSLITMLIVVFRLWLCFFDFLAQHVDRGNLNASKEADRKRFLMVLLKSHQSFDLLVDTQIEAWRELFEFVS